MAYYHHHSQESRFFGAFLGLVDPLTHGSAQIFGSRVAVNRFGCLALAEASVVNRSANWPGYNNDK